MRLFSFDPASGRAITDWSTRGVSVGSLLGVQEETDINCVRFDRDGMLGRHPAGRQQVFAVIAGEGWVSGPDGTRHPIKAGQAAFWDVGESHESGSAAGMTVIVIQSPSLDPSRMQPLD